MSQDVEAIYSQVPQMMEVLAELAYDFGAKNVEQVENEFGDTLEITFDKVGEAELPVLAEVNFLNGDDDDSFVVVQVSATVFEEVPEDQYPDVLLACNCLNNDTVAGHFGVEDDLLYFCQNVILRSDYKLENMAQMVADAVVVLERTLQATIDSLALIVSGEMTFEDAVEEEIL